MYKIKLYGILLLFIYLIIYISIIIIISIILVSNIYLLVFYTIIIRLYETVLLFLYASTDRSRKQTFLLKLIVSLDLDAIIDPLVKLNVTIVYKWDPRSKY